MPQAYINDVPSPRPSQKPKRCQASVDHAFRSRERFETLTSPSHGLIRGRSVKLERCPSFLEPSRSVATDVTASRADVGQERVFGQR